MVVRVRKVAMDAARDVVLGRCALDVERVQSSGGQS